MLLYLFNKIKLFIVFIISSGSGHAWVAAATNQHITML